MGSSSFLVVSLGLSMYSIMSSTNSDSLTFSFPIWIPFVSVSLKKKKIVKISKIMLRKSGKIYPYPCSILDFRGNAFNSSPLSMMLAVGLSYMALIMLSYVPSMPTFWGVLIINEC